MRGQLTAAKTLLDSCGSFCCFLFIKVAVVQVTKGIRRLSRLSCGSSVVTLFSLTNKERVSSPRFFYTVLGQKWWGEINLKSSALT